MAQILNASIYGAGSYDLNSTQGFTKGFPVQGIFIESIAEAPQVFSGKSCVSKITLLPTGLQTNGKEYFSTTAAATLITNANA
jgi:hypothetical protein